ncbi:MAG: LssY C-terminal domain-containing protein [Deltaproteobacteria bacterium]|nr:MAG: LssY C-terminal domain-containing protein [Deltaproteobacteria bacterium]
MSRLWLGLLVVFTLAASGCATFKPRPIDEVRFRARAQTKSDGKVRVTVAVLSAEETKEVFDLDLYRKGIQPIWMEIENNYEERVWVPHVGLDPDYFAPLEVAYMHRYSFSEQANREMEQYFHDNAMRYIIDPGSVRSGFVFTHLQLGTKSFNVDLIWGDHQFTTFTFFIPVPGLRVDHREVDWQSLYSRNEFVSYDETGLREALENLPCCTTNEDSTKQGGPLNLVVIGSGQDVHHAFIRSGWDETETRNPASGSTTRTSSVYSGRYRHAATSPLYVFGRPQDVVFRKSRKTARERAQISLWLSPMTLEGKPVWIGQINREIRARSEAKRYRIEPDLDEARTYILQDLIYSQGLVKFGHVKGVGAATISAPRENLKGQAYFTDGYRVVLWVSSRPISFSEVGVVEWERPFER